jgi:uncharacterized protein
MRAFGAILVSVFLLGVFCSAQEAASPATDSNSEQSVAAAARANKQSKIDPQKEADIRRLLQVMGTERNMTQVMANMETNIRPLLTSSFPAGEYRERLIQLFFEKFHSKIDMQELIGLAIPVYDKYLSDSDIKALIDFYSTPLGQKVINVLPNIISESGEKGRQWGERVGRESMIEVLQEHPDLQQAMQASKKDTLPK